MGLIGLIGVSHSFAQTAPSAASNVQVVITWQANNYFPAGFEGKSLPAPYAQVVASVELLEDNKLADLSQATVNWFVDDKFQKSGVGLKTFSFYTQQEDSGYVSVRAVIELQGGGGARGSLQIPIVAPTLVLSYAAPSNSVAANSSVTLAAIPFSFNVSSPSDLTFFWTINGAQSNVSGNTVKLQLGAPTPLDRLLQISVSAQNNKNPLEIGKTAAAFPIQ